MKRVILFDGVCNFCDRSVQFIIKHDPKQTFQFASLQSDIGKKLLKEYQLFDEIDSIVLIEGDKTYVESTAALKIAKQLNGFYAILGGLLVIPKPIRDAIYHIIARNRYKWFGKKEVCMLPRPEDKQRFLD